MIKEGFGPLFLFLNMVGFSQMRNLFVNDANAIYLVL